MTKMTTKNLQLTFRPRFCIQVDCENTFCCFYYNGHDVSIEGIRNLVQN